MVRVSVRLQADAPPGQSRYRGTMDAAPSPLDRASDRCVAWLSETSIVFPVAALVVSLLTFASTSPSPPIVGLLGLALLPWALIAGHVRITPLVVVIVTLVPTFVLVLRYDDQAALFLGVVTCTWAAASGMRLPTSVAVIGFSAASVVCDIRLNFGTEGGWAIWSTGMLFGWFAGALLFRQRSLTDALADARHELGLAAVEHERKAIAREVHDIVGHSLTVVLLNISGARRNLANNPAAAADALERAEAVSRDSLETVRSVVSLLSSAGESQRDAPLPGGGDLVPLLDQARQSGMPIVSTIAGDPARLEPSIGLTLVRLLQEALANASRHAPGATVDVDVDIDDHRVTATVANAMPASARSASDRVGVGLASMHDRVAAVSGSIRIGAEHGRWLVHATLPRSQRSVHLTPSSTSP